MTAADCVIREMDDGTEYQVHFKVTSAGCSAQTYGPPENCYPAEGPEWEITSVEVEQEDGTWVDIRKCLQPEQVDPIERWSENLDLEEEVMQSLQDESDANDEYHYEQRRDPLD